MKKRLTALVMAFLLGLLLFHFRIPIPFMLSGIISASVLKFFVWTDMRWGRFWGILCSNRHIAAGGLVHL